MCEDFFVKIYYFIFADDTGNTVTSFQLIWL